ncbi:hypothetical protein PRZ48_003416 [Zasmidium cellare]|uniref:Uncharacterized protein n=1 Tax=Zasmidium cellare TaxID=395010 RepID=A0ABR0EWJ8_ZASCE|nr:hypothetical protein PRZ48_003416 [Zasmidium cellare]
MSPPHLTWTIVTLPKPPECDEQLLRALARKYRDYRLKAVEQESSPVHRAEQDRALASFEQELADPGYIHTICLAGPASSVSTQSEALLRSDWVGGCRQYGPITEHEWSRLPTLPQSSTVSECYHSNHLFVLPPYRGLKGPSGESIIVELDSANLAATAIRMRPRHPAGVDMALHQRATVPPNATRLLKEVYEKVFGFTVTGYVPLATSLVVNRNAEGLEWPTREEDEEFYARCDRAVVERVVRVDAEGRVRVRTPTANAPNPSKAFQYRHSLSLAGSVVNLSAVSDIGTLSEQPTLLSGLKDAGALLLHERKVLDAFHWAVENSPNHG